MELARLRPVIGCLHLKRLDQSKRGRHRDVPGEHAHPRAVDGVACGSIDRRCASLRAGGVDRGEVRLACADRHDAPRIEQHMAILDRFHRTGQPLERHARDQYGL
jgi:hypothetical protein